MLRPPGRNGLAAKLRIAILGTGSMGRVHAAAYKLMPDVEVAGTSNARASSDVEALIADPATDAIDVCLPTERHTDVVVRALEHGKHVFCETPLAFTLHDATRMRDAARRTGRLLQVGLLMRSVSAYRHLASLAQSGEHGRLLDLSTWRLGAYLRPDAPNRKAHHGPPATELMTFDFDVVRWIMGAPAMLSATGGDRVTARLEFDDGRRATVVASGLMPVDAPFTVGFRAVFERATIELQTVFDCLPPRNTFTIAIGTAAPQPLDLAQHDPYGVELRHFVDCIRGIVDPAWLDADRALEALDLSLATERALHERPASS